MTYRWSHIIAPAVHVMAADENKVCPHCTLKEIKEPSCPQPEPGLPAALPLIKSLLTP